MNGYKLLGIALDWSGVELSSDEVKKHHCVKHSADSITISSELLEEHKPEWDKLSGEIKDGFWFIKFPAEGHITMRRFKSNEDICRYWEGMKKDFRNRYMMALIRLGELEFIGEYME